MRSCKVDVVVVGAGPAGCAAATAAAEAGREVLLLERMFVPRDKPCGDGVASRAVAALQTMGVEERIRRRGYHPRRRILSSTPMVWRAATARDATPSPHGLSRGTNILSRSRTSLPASAAAVAAAQPAGPAPTTTTSTLQDLIFPTRGGAYPAADGPAVVLSCSRVTFLLQSIQNRLFRQCIVVVG